MTDKTSTKQKPTTTKPLFSCWHSWTKPQSYLFTRQTQPHWPFISWQNKGN